MVVCAHGDVAKFCEAHDMQILKRYIGYLDEYKGDCPVVVTDLQMTRQEYDRLKCTLFARGVELVSTDWTDDEVILRLLQNQIDQRGKRGGRQIFGFTKTNGVITTIPEKIRIVRRIFEMRDGGCTLREIKREVDLSMSTIQTILRNREVYKDVEL